MPMAAAFLNASGGDHPTVRRRVVRRLEALELSGIRRNSELDRHEQRVTSVFTRSEGDHV
jgi:hypothetical protein